MKFSTKHRANLTYDIFINVRMCVYVCIPYVRLIKASSWGVRMPFGGVVDDVRSVVLLLSDLFHFVSALNYRGGFCHVAQTFTHASKLALHCEWLNDKKKESKYQQK